MSFLRNEDCKDTGTHLDRRIDCGNPSPAR
jgi:hypothetical protein